MAKKDEFKDLFILEMKNFLYINNQDYWSLSYNLNCKQNFK